MANPAIDKLRLGASSKAVALADVSAADLMASMSDEQKTELAAALAPPKAEEAPKGESAPGGKAEEKPAAKGEEEGKGAAAKGDAADPDHVQYGHGFVAACERTRTVAASKEFVGRESAGVELLGNAKLSADEVISTLAALPKGGSDMLAGLKSKNPDLGAGGETDSGSSKADASSVWDRTFAERGWN